MGIEYRAVIVVGLPYDDLETRVDDLPTLIDGGNVAAYSPYFDAPYHHCVIGFGAMRSDDYSYERITQQQITESILVATNTWQEMFPGITPSIYLMPHGW